LGLNIQFLGPAGLRLRIQVPGLAEGVVVFGFIEDAPRAAKSPAEVLSGAKGAWCTPIGMVLR
jgi:hypothetical protein